MGLERTAFTSGVYGTLGKTVVTGTLEYDSIGERTSG
ncbi:hypothetical protein COLO4_36316 [Corchorus olitorius]|uniref:Uncharacterized protein n=1 Tax=Corchorus olitorius TaxID=93759 RepID=A0A1R3G9Z3_9ROSI|nr:hypothetical protein COLO4_36316 [Corchorus olitorius]